MPSLPPSRRAAALALVAAVLALHAWLLARWPAVPAVGVPAGDDAARRPARPHGLVATLVRPRRSGGAVPDAAVRAPTVRPPLPVSARQRAAAAPPSARAMPPAGPATTNKAVSAEPPRPPADLSSDPASPARAQAAAGSATASPAGSATAVAPPAVAGDAPPNDPPAAGRPPPIYPAQPPPPLALRYRVVLGTHSGQALLTWRHDGRRYRLELAAAVHGAALLEQASDGAFDAAGLAPERFVDRRHGRGARAANFRRDDGLITFSGARNEHRAWPGAQDRLSWIAQLAAVARAAQGTLPAPLSLFVVDAGGYGALWSFEVRGTETVETAAGPAPATLVVREPQALSDWRVEVWLSDSDHWPLKLRMTVLRSGSVLELVRADEAPVP